ncbi:hypothetical protein CGLO_14891 [Colletotrichum gloeosporioides Cg-14]|uniref:Uncharacterized protein n=1 Tax=Colletotrichum gloeosporioides (strain Cg-14) TaxID=1237896 RepID=T0K2Z5_COLGC|nr:hypothetical protein CGLO_14891 [Colletotrichum gloeosporioides Cg-14]
MRTLIPYEFSAYSTSN